MGYAKENLNGVPVSALDCQHWRQRVGCICVAQSCSEMACGAGPEWMPGSSRSLQAVSSVDPRPDTVEDVLNVCPQQAASFGGRHLRLAWVDSPPDPSQGWRGCGGPVRVRVDTALRPQDPAVMIMPGPRAAARDPVVRLRACAVPPHFVQPWATVEVVREGSGDGGGGGGGGGDGDVEPVTEGTEVGDARSALRPESALELLRGCVVRSGGVVHLLHAPADAACRGVRLLCRRAPEYVIPLSAGSPSGTKPATGASASRRAGGSHRSRNGKTSHGRRRGTRWRSREGEHAKEKQKMGACGEGETERLGTKQATAGMDVACTRRGDSATGAIADAVGSSESGTPGEETSVEKEGDWAGRLSDWGAVTISSEVVVPHKALEVSYNDISATAPTKTTCREGRPPTRGEPVWVETVLQSHEASVVDDLSAAFELAETGISADGVAGRREEMAVRGGGVDGGGGNGALLVHGPPGVGKTRLVEALAARLGCRLVKLSPGRLAAIGGIHADQVLSEAFQYCRRCVSRRVVLLLDSIDRLTPAARGNVGASRGEVDAGMLNSFVLAVEQGRRDPRWRGRVAVVGVTSWPDQVHPTARRCVGQEVLVLPPSQPLRARILSRALLHTGKWEEASADEGGKSPATSAQQDAFEEVVGLCQGFTAGDMCAVAAAAAAPAGSRLPDNDDEGRQTAEQRALTRAEALRAGFRQVRQRVAAGRGGAGGGGGGSASVAGVPRVRWSEVGGLERAKRAVQEMVVWPARFPEAFSRMGITPASGVLLFGPPGTGKTLLAKAAATETGATFIELKVSDVVRGEIGESEKAVDQAFRTARELAPSIVFIDEFQALFASREAGGGTGSRLASQLLVCMDELARWRAAARRSVADIADGKDSAGDNDGPAPAAQGGEGRGGGGSANVMVLAATNAPEAVDAAFLRPGRFDEIVYAGLPDADGRRQILGASKARMEGLSTTAAAAAGAMVAEAPPSTQLPPPDDSDTRVLLAAQQVKTSPPAVDSSAGASTETTAAMPTKDERGSGSPVHPDRGSSTGGNGSRPVGGGSRGGRWASDVDLLWLSRQTKGYSGADLSSLVRNAAMVALREEGGGGGQGGRRGALSSFVGGGRGTGRKEGVLIITRKHFEAALASTQPSSGAETAAKHERWARQWHVGS